MSDQQKTGVLENMCKNILHKSTETIAPTHVFQNRATPSCPSHTLKNAQSEKDVFRLLGTNFGCPALYKEPLQGQSSALKAELQPRRGELV